MMIQMTEQLARAAGWDAGNRSAAARGENVWSEEDFRVAAREFARLWPLSEEAVRED